VKNRKNLLVTLADKNYIQQAKQLFSSVYWNAGWNGDYMLLSHEIPEEDLKWFREKGILIRECKPLYNGPMGDGSYATLVLDKFYLFTEEFKQWGHIVFLDADIIVRASIDELTKTTAFSSPKTLKKYFIVYFYLSDSKELPILKEEYGLKRLFKPAFNSGVMSFNTSIIKDDTFDNLMTIFKKYANISNGDDSILNLFFYNQWIPVPLVYNVRVYHLGFIKRQGIILHFERPSRTSEKNTKPWDEGTPFYKEWKSNLDRAEFIDLNRIQKGKKWTPLKIKSYSLILNINVYVILYINIIFDRLKAFFLNKIKPFFIYNVKSFFSYKVRFFFIYVLKTPDRLIGRIGFFIKKYNPDLYDKLKKRGK